MVLLSCINTSFSYFVHPSYISERRLKSIKFKKKKNPVSTRGSKPHFANDHIHRLSYSRTR